MFLPFDAPIWFYRQPVDFRKQIDGFVVLVADTLNRNPTSGQFFVFRNKQADKIKMLYWDDNGFWLLFKSDEVMPSYCNAHARRYFETIANSTTTGLSHEAMRTYNRLFKIEEIAKKNKLTPDLRLALRRAQSKTIMDEFKAWLDKYYPTVLPKSPLGTAFAYCIKHWTGLTEFLTDGHLLVHNNHTELKIKPFVQAKKTFCFARQ